MEPVLVMMVKAKLKTKANLKIKIKTSLAAVRRLVLGLMTKTLTPTIAGL
jgi:hypothetical protein